MAIETGMTEDFVTGCRDFDVSYDEPFEQFRQYTGGAHQQLVIPCGRDTFRYKSINKLKSLDFWKGQARFSRQGESWEAYQDVDLDKLKARIILEGKPWLDQGQVVLINVERSEEGAISETESRKIEKTPCVMRKEVIVSEGEVGELKERVGRVFGMGAEESFEDGMISKFSSEICSLVINKGDFAILEISHLILKEKVAPELASEALRWLGRVDDDNTYSSRSWLLQRSLGCSSAYVRDGAALGIASMNDTRAIQSLEKAIECEKYAELKKDLEEVLAQLKGNICGAAS
ncbi:MAG TPA: HEAT repeat domain-containing protein [Planctomycetes bacterium]|nr:HEAT repeat domain-containing protein [Planctomycetota bacterium]